MNEGQVAASSTPCLGLWFPAVFQDAGSAQPCMQRILPRPDGSCSGMSSGSTEGCPPGSNLPRRETLNNVRQGSGRKTTPRSFDFGKLPAAAAAILAGSAGNNAPVNSEPNSRAEERPPESKRKSPPHKARPEECSLRSTQPATAAQDLPQPNHPRAVTIRMRVVKRRAVSRPAERAGKEPSIKPIAASPEPQLHPPAFSPAPPETLIKSQGCWYIHPSPALEATPSQGRTPSSLVRAPGCWYVQQGGASALTPGVSSRQQQLSAPSTQAHAKGCWYLPHTKTPSTARALRRRDLPPLPSTTDKVRRVWYLDAEPEEVLVLDREGKPSVSVTSSAKTGRGKAVTFRDVLENAVSSALTAKQQQQVTSGVLTDLRNNYQNGPPSRDEDGCNSSASKWQVNYGPGLSPYTFSPIPIRLVEADQECPDEPGDANIEQESQDMEIDASPGKACPPAPAGDSLEP